MNRARGVRQHLAGVRGRLWGPPVLPRWSSGLVGGACLLLLAMMLVEAPRYKQAPVPVRLPAQEEEAAAENAAPGDEPAARSDAARPRGARARAADKDDPKPEPAPEPKIRVKTIPVWAGSHTGSDRGHELRMQEAQSLVAMNIFLRSGFLDGAQVSRQALPDGTEEVHYRVTIDQSVASCVPWDSRDEAGEAARLALAVVAIEKFNRTALHRRVEWLLARAAMKAGRLPDLSLGPAQLKPGTLRQAAARGAGDQEFRRTVRDDAALANALGDECKSLEYVATLLQHLMKSRDDRSVLVRYSGGRRSTDAVIHYEAIAERMAGMIEVPE